MGAEKVKEFVGIEEFVKRVKGQGSILWSRGMCEPISCYFWNLVLLIAHTPFLIT